MALSFSFRTATAEDTTPPVLTSAVPADAALNVDARAVLQYTLTDPLVAGAARSGMDATSIAVSIQSVLAFVAGDDPYVLVDGGTIQVEDWTLDLNSSDPDSTVFSLTPSGAGAGGATRVVIDCQDNAGNAAQFVLVFMVSAGVTTLDDASFLEVDEEGGQVLTLVSNASFVARSYHVYALPPGSTLLTAEITLGDTVLPVFSTANFPTSGGLLINGVTVTYTGITDATFTGCGGTQAVPAGTVCALRTVPVSPCWSGVVDQGAVIYTKDLSARSASPKRSLSFVLPPLAVGDASRLAFVNDANENDVFQAPDSFLRVQPRSFYSERYTLRGMMRPQEVCGPRTVLVEP